MSSSFHIQPADFAPTVLKLFQGPIFDDDTTTWTQLELYQSDIRDYLAQIGIELVIQEDDGYAYLTQDIEELKELKLPKVIRRRALSYEVTLLCVALLQKLLEFDAQDTDSPRLFLNRSQIVDEIELLFPEGNNRSRLLEKIDAYISAVTDLGYIRKVRRTHLRPDDEDRYEVRRIIKARLTPEQLQDILQSLQPDTNEHTPAAN